MTSMRPTPDAYDVVAENWYDEDRRSRFWTSNLRRFSGQANSDKKSRVQVRAERELAHSISSAYLKLKPLRDRFCARFWTPPSPELRFPGAPHVIITDA